KSYNNINLLEIVSDSMSYTLAPNTPNNQAVRYVLHVDNQHYIISDTVEFFYGKFNSEYNPSTNSLSNWNNSGWSISNSSYHSAPSSIKSSPANGNYPDNSALILQLQDPIDLTA